LKNSRFLLILLLLLACSAVAIGTAFRFDVPVRAAVVKSQGKQWKKSDEQKFHAAVRVYGDWPWLMLYGGIGLGVAWKLRNRDWQRILAAAMLASTLAGIVANASRLSTGRTRPNAGSKIEQGFYGPWKDGRTTIGDRAYNSFPSGHTATAFGLAWVIVFARPWLGIGALILAGLVGWSSIIMGAHHPSDVVVSIFLSLGVSWFTWKWVEKNGDRVAQQAGQWWKRRRRSQVATSRRTE
jgi:membrane-associated phospholipid phosphatase